MPQYLHNGAEMPEKTKVQMMIEIRELIDSDRTNPYFNREEVENIVEYINGPTEFGSSATSILPKHIPNWERQLTSSLHPSYNNCKKVLDILLENTIFEDEEEQTEEQTEEQSLAGSQTDTAITLIDFVRSMSPEVAKEVISIEQKAKTFIVTLR